MEYRLASPQQVPDIVAFMDAHWGSQHPCLHRPTYFRHYFCTGEGLNFALAMQGQKICAVCGFTPCNRQGTAIWLSLWQADPQASGEGLELMSRMAQLTGASLISCNNIRQRVLPLYRFLGFTTGQLCQYVRLAPRQRYLVASPAGLLCPAVDPEIHYRPIPSFEELQRLADFPPTAPYKDLWYLQRRFFAFPGYRYQLYGLYRQGRIRAMLALRAHPVGESCVLRLVDFWGSDDDFALVGGTVDDLLRRHGAEYADLYCTGLSPAALQTAGFVPRTQDAAAIIPNYLDPLLRENTDYFYCTTDPTNFRMCKADGDQDRPNLG